MFVDEPFFAGVTNIGKIGLTAQFALQQKLTDLVGGLYQSKALEGWSCLLRIAILTAVSAERAYLCFPVAYMKLTCTIFHSRHEAIILMAPPKSGNVHNASAMQVQSSLW